jgi:hypothetical protein
MWCKCIFNVSTKNGVLGIKEGTILSAIALSLLDTLKNNKHLVTLHSMKTARLQQYKYCNSMNTATV